MPIVLALRIAAVAIILAAGINFMLNGAFLWQPVIVANILFLLSFFAAYDERRITLLTLPICAILLIGAVRFYLDGRYTLPWSITELVVYGFLTVVAWSNFRKGGGPG